MSNNLLVLGNKYIHDRYSEHLDASGKRVFLYRDDPSVGNHSLHALFTSDASIIQPTGTTSSVFQGSPTTLDFNLPAGGVGNLSQWNDMYLKMDVRNTSGAAIMTVLPSFFMVNYVELNSNGSQLTTLYDYQMMEDYLLSVDNDEDVRNEQSYARYANGIAGTAIGTGSTIAISTTVSIWLKINSLFTRGKVDVDNLTSQLSLRFHFDSTGLVSTSASTSISLVKAQLLIEGLNYETNIRQQLLNRHKMYDHIFSYYEPMRVVYTAKALSSVSKTNIPLTEFSNMSLSHLVIYAVPTGSTREGLYNFQPMSTMNLVLNGKAIADVQDSDIAWVRLKTNKFYHGLSTLQSNNIYVITHSADPRKAQQTGVDLGLQYYPVNMSLEIISAATATFDIYVTGFRYTNIVLQKGGTVGKISL